jgi:hypothetical protein
MGIEYFCTGVGLSYFASARLRITTSPSTVGSNASIGSGQLSPDTSTGMSSY